MSGRKILMQGSYLTYEIVGNKKIVYDNDIVVCEIALDEPFESFFMMLRRLGKLPERIQRKRTKGWKMPENAVYVGRPTKWGNPFKVIFEDNQWCVKDNEGNYWGEIYENKKDAVEKSVECYSGWVDGQILIKKLNLNELKGKDLACFCGLSSSCHADVLIKLLTNKK